MKDNLEDKQIALIMGNVNVSKTNHLVETFWYAFALFLICVFIFFFSDCISQIFVSCCSNETQLKIEKMLSFEKPYDKPKYPDKLSRLNNIKIEIVKRDHNLQNKSEFNIYEDPSEIANAFVAPNGTIYFTRGLLEKINDDKMLAFVLAHEMGHYAHRDHLKSLSRSVLAAVILSVVSDSGGSVSRVMNGAATYNENKYSNRQEKNADLYAFKTIKALYGDTSAAVDFFKLLDKESNMPEFMYYFSTHPSPKARIKLMQEAI